MAPEQILGKNHDVDARSDLWSVGATAFALVSGRFVHEAETPEEMMVFTGSRQARSLAAVAPEVPAEFIKVVDRALRFDKAERWPTAGMMRTAFARACSSEHECEHASPSGERTEPEQHAQALPARAGSVGDDSPLSPTLICPGMPGTPRRRGGGHRRTRVAFALALTCCVAAVSSYAARGPARAFATGFASPVVPSESRTDIVDPEPAEIHASAPVATLMPERHAADDGALTPTAVGGAGERTATTSESPKALASRTLTRSDDRASTTSRPRAQASTAPASDGCKPPYTIVPITGKKLWKRECL
jgi:hypothetical protein